MIEIREDHPGEQAAPGLRNIQSASLLSQIRVFNARMVQNRNWIPMFPKDSLTRKPKPNPPKN